MIAVVNRYFKVQLSLDDVIHKYSGVRPLFDDNADNPSAVTRDYLFDLDVADTNTPLLSVYGGKLTTYRKLAEQAVDILSEYYSLNTGAWTAKASLPGGDIPDADYESFARSLGVKFSQLPENLLSHYGRLYGTRTLDLLTDVETLEQLGQHFGHLLYEVEVRYLVRHEWACTANDILQRRTKHGLHLSSDQRLIFEEWFSCQYVTLMQER